MAQNHSRWPGQKRDRPDCGNNWPKAFPQNALFPSHFFPIGGPDPLNNGASKCPLYFPVKPCTPRQSLTLKGCQGIHNLLLDIATIGIFAQRSIMKEYNITIQSTNNPKIIKLEANHFLAKGNYEYKNIDEAKNSPLAQQPFHLPLIKTVYIASNFVGLERYDIVEWEDVKDEVAQQLVEYLNAGETVVNEEEGSGKVPISLYAEVTPNPAVMKFVCNKRIVPAIFEFKDIDQA